MKIGLLRSPVWPTLLFVVVFSFGLHAYFGLTAAGTIEPPVPPEQTWLVGADPAADFERAKERGDLRFWGTSGGTLGSSLVPGIEEEQHWELVERQGVRYIERTTSCTSHAADLRRGWFYAARYNALLREHLEK